MIWLSLLVPTVIGVYLAISERRDIGVLGVAGAIFLGVHVIIAPFFGPAINSSGKKYTLKAVQPVLHVSDSGYQWSVTARNEWIRAWFAGPLLLGLGIVSLTAFRSDTGRGPIMPYIGGLLIFLALYLVVKLLATDVAAEMHDNAFTYSSRGFPFHRQEHRILRIDATHFWQHDDPIARRLLPTPLRQHRDNLLLARQTVPDNTKQQRENPRSLFQKRDRSSGRVHVQQLPHVTPALAQRLQEAPSIWFSRIPSVSLS